MLIMCKSESELMESLYNKFSKYSDFTIEQEAITIRNNKTLRPDLVIKYGGKPVACVELKMKNTWENLRSQVRDMLKYSDIKFCFIVVNGIFKNYNALKDELEDSNEDEILRKLSDSVSQNAETCEEQIVNSFRRLVKTKKEWEKLSTILLEYLNKDFLKKCGCNIFLDEYYEIDLFRKLLLEFSYRDLPKEICRYTSAKYFYFSLKDGFRLSSVEAMNDEFETKVIDDYPHLKSVQAELPNYIYNGFILSFSDINQKDKLPQWYMYGNKATGVCFIVEPKYDNSNKEVFWAPVIYIPKKSETGQTHNPTLLDFLNELIGSEIEDKYHFKFKYWHYWKYFFKYDYYKEEAEVRLLIIQDKRGNTDWSEVLDTPYHYISKKEEELPFEIKGVILGPKHKTNNNLHKFIYEELGNSIDVYPSKILGYQ